MNAATKKAMAASEEQLRLFLHWTRATAQRITDALDRKIPVVDILGGSAGPVGKLPKRPFSSEEEDMIDTDGFKELIRVAVGARCAYREVITIRRHGK